jgi:putative Ca2+/H+ antiporter (TMEM165/GDT1 family)
VLERRSWEEKMEWRIFVTTFTSIFVAELADKTQLVGIGMSAKSGKPFTVLAGSVCAYILVTAISVFVGVVLAKFIKPELIRYAGAGIFILIGVLILLGKI